LDLAKLDEENAKSLSLGLTFETTPKTHVQTDLLDTNLETTHRQEIKPTKLDFEVLWMQVSTELNDIMAHLTQEVVLEFFEFK